MSNKILIVGIGYVGLAQALLLHKKNNVDVIDIDEEKVNAININKSPVNEKEFINYFDTNKVSIKAFQNREELELDYDFVIICLPTNYNFNDKVLDTVLVEDYIDFFVQESNTKIIIKSTVSIGFTDSQIKKYNNERISFSPEFLREGTSIEDCMKPSRIIYGPKNICSMAFDKIIQKSLEKKVNKTRYMSASEAEAVKLFSNTYLALRVAFFNELDNLAISNKMNAMQIIKGICDDERIGMFYNNPSFGFGGYCLPKDSNDLSNFLLNKNIPSDLINSINTSNFNRKEFLSQQILKEGHKIIGIYRINMKSKSANYRDSAVLDILKNIKKENVEVIIYEPLINQNEFLNCKIEKDLHKFKNNSDLIITNRIDNNIIDVESKIFTRDLFRAD